MAPSDAPKRATPDAPHADADHAALEPNAADTAPAAPAADFESPLIPTADGSATLHHPIYDQTYHSHHGAVTESLHVFVGHSDLAVRLTRGPVRLLEVGIGTGLNLALSASLALRTGGELHYEGIEQQPPGPAAMQALAYDRYDAVDAQIWTTMREAFVARAGGFEIGAKGSARLHWALFQTLDLGKERVDIVYHDAFSPEVNPELWADEALGAIIAAMKPGAVLVTYTVQGDVRRRLAAHGLTVERLPGPPGGKRQVLRATKPA